MDNIKKEKGLITKIKRLAWSFFIFLPSGTDDKAKSERGTGF